MFTEMPKYTLFLFVGAAAVKAAKAVATKALASISAVN
jgi:hypothetical protein